MHEAKHRQTLRRRQIPRLAIQRRQRRVRRQARQRQRRQ